MDQKHANSEHRDEMLHYAAFMSVHTVYEDKKYLKRKIYDLFLEIITCHPSIYAMDQARRNNPLLHKGLIKQS